MENGSDAVDVTVMFDMDTVMWKRTFRAPRGITLLEFKELMIRPEGTRRDADSFELKLWGHRVHDSERIVTEHTLDFDFIGPEEGERRAMEDAVSEPAEEARLRTPPKRRAPRGVQASAPGAEAHLHAPPPDPEAAGAISSDATNNVAGNDARAPDPEVAAAAPGAGAPPQPTPEEDIEVKVLCAADDSEIDVRVPPAATVLDVRKAVLLAIGGSKLSTVKLVKREANGLGLRLADEEAVGARRSFVAVGDITFTAASAQALDTAAAAPAQADADRGPITVHIEISNDSSMDIDLTMEPGATILDVKAKLVASDPTGTARLQDFGIGISAKHAGAEQRAILEQRGLVPLPDDTALTPDIRCLRCTGALTAAAKAQLPKLSMPQALALQQEILEKFQSAEFQAKRASIKSSNVDKKLILRQLQEHTLSAQVSVLPKYGFPGTREGVFTMISAFGPYANHPEVLRGQALANELIGTK